MVYVVLVGDGVVVAHNDLTIAVFVRARLVGIDFLFCGI